jgi:outer membrane immunogenic protein
MSKVSKSRFLGMCAAVVMVAASARAADLPIDRNVYVEVPPAIGLFNWTGFYVGGNLGYGRSPGSVDISANGPFLSIPETLSGVIGGVQGGANWQTGNAVFGIEGDIQGSGQSASNAITRTLAATAFTPAITAISNTDKITSFGTLRGRVGIASNHALAYATAGVGYLSFRSDLNFTGLGSGSYSGSQIAGVIGAGMEFAIVNNWSVRAEYLFLQTRNISSSPFAAAPAVEVNTRIRDNIFRVGVNYLFLTGSVGCRPHLC